MKRFLLLLMVFAACESSSREENRFNTSALPANIQVYEFSESYSPLDGQYELRFFMKNLTNDTIVNPQIDGDVYIEGKVAAQPLGGPGKDLAPLDSGEIILALQLPDQRPDSIIFRLK